ncbi:MAG TPA: tandem-95 repeat protein, partial [Candidatus Sulfotelmatobacter sp.]|nr:tandem-95 repeat protein [Candidatus Sulfotelmatobacter sp.]
QLGALINLYSHTLSTGYGDAHQLTPEYITYGLNPNLHPRTWSVNSAALYQWSLQRAKAQVTVASTTNGNQAVTTLSIAGATDTNTAVELLFPSLGAVASLQVLTNGVVASADAYRVNGQVLKVRVGNSVTNAQVWYVLAPVAQGDFFTALPGKTFTVPAPGVLSNDLAGNATSLTAARVSGPTNGSLTLYPNGSFSYTPAVGFVGPDSFTYQVNNGLTNSTPATVSLAVVPGQTLLAEDFNRPAELSFLSSLSPWVPLWGNWSASGGLLRGQGGREELQNHDYGYIYLTNSWTNYSVEARIRFPSPSAFGGGVGGRLNPATGAHYALWLYPDGSPGGGNLLKLLKFQTWRSFGSSNGASMPVQQVSVGAVGTNWHTLKLLFQGREIVAYYDGNQVMDFVDLEAPPYLSGGVCFGMWTETDLYTMEVDKVVVVRPWVGADDYSVAMNTPLVVPTPGILANDSGLYGANLTASLVSGPAQGTLDFSSNGAFSYVPASNFFGTVSFVYQVSDGVTNLGSATVTITVIPPPPAFRITNISLSNQVAWITWNAVAEKTYLLQYKTRLEETNWIDVLPKVTATNSTCIMTNALDSGMQRFYRLVLLP